MTKMKRRIGVVPFGAVPQESLEAIAAQIPRHLGFSAHILPPMEHPSFAYDSGRLQYNAAHIIRSLEDAVPPECSKILGVLSVDLFLPVFTHVFGEAREGGQCAVVSLYRLKRDTKGMEVPTDVVAERTAKVALHELAHLFDLAHCMDRDCLMHFSMDLQELDEMSMEFCEYCKAYLAEGLRR